MWGKSLVRPLQERGRWCWIGGCQWCVSHREQRRRSWEAQVFWFIGTEKGRLGAFSRSHEYERFIVEQGEIYRSNSGIRIYFFFVYCSSTPMGTCTEANDRHFVSVTCDAFLSSLVSTMSSSLSGLRTVKRDFSESTPCSSQNLPISWSPSNPDNLTCESFAHGQY